MASVNWDKQTKQKAGAMQRHNGKEERVQLNHSNPDIDKAKSHLNYYIGCDDYKDAYQAMCKRVDEVDKQNPPERKVKDRVVCVSLEAPCPQEIFNAGRSEEFFRELHKTYEKFFGKENVHGSCVHLDEMHNYIENGVEKTSLAHAHTLVSAYAEWQKKDKQGNVSERRGINGKNFETKARLNALNKAVCEMVRDKFGVEYNTGEKSQRGRTVEELKAKQALEKIKKETNDYVRSITPSTTKKVKGIFGEKEVEKKPDELERDKQILAAQAVLQRESAVAKTEEEQRQTAAQLAALEEKLDKENQALKNQKRSWEIEKQLIVRGEVQKLLDKGGYVAPIDFEAQRQHMQQPEKTIRKERDEYGRD